VLAAREEKRKAREADAKKAAVKKSKA